MMIKSRTFLVICFLVCLPNAFAARFANQFVEFELPPKWNCSLEGAEWVCQSTVVDKKREAIIILAAKLKGDQDSLDQYAEHLKKAKHYTAVNKKPVKSEVKSTDYVTINNHTWIDSLHLESEIPGYYTRYLATVKDDIGILVTYSINKDKYHEYLSVFDNMVKTLRAFRKTGGLNAAPSGSNIFDQTTNNIPPAITSPTVFPDTSEAEVENPSQGGDDDDLTLYLLLAILGGLGYMIWKKKKQGQA